MNGGENWYSSPLISESNKLNNFKKRNVDVSMLHNRLKFKSLHLVAVIKS